MRSAVVRYRRVLTRPGVPLLLMLGFLVRMPVFAAAIVLTLHVVDSLDRSYGAAGVVAAAATLAIAISGPWRGRLLDRLGLRRVVAPSLAVGAVCWSIAPFADYWWLLALAAFAGLFQVPTFTIIRQSVIAAVPEDDRRTSISLDAVVVELAFMAAPAIGVWAATIWPTSWVLFGIEMVGLAAGLVIWVVNPPLREESVDEAAASAQTSHVPRSAWFGLAFMALCLCGFATSVVLSGTEIGIIAALRSFDSSGAIGMVLAAWGLGSLIGGLTYGGLSRSISPYVLLAALALVTAPMALATNAVLLGALSFVAGLLCAPTITASLDLVSKLVPSHSRGEAIGWHGSLMMIGVAAGSPLAGFAIDHLGWWAGFVVVAVCGALVAGLGFSVKSQRARQRRKGAPVTSSG